MENYNIWADNTNGVTAQDNEIKQHHFGCNNDKNELNYPDDKTIEIHTLEEFTANIDCLADDEILIWNDIPFASYKEIDYEYDIN